MLRLLMMLWGPIFAKELLEIARRSRYYWSRVLYGLALLAALLLVGEQCRQLVRAEGHHSLRILAATGENLFRTVSIVQYGAVFLFVPIFVCGAIAGERQERTLEALLATSLSDCAIVLGKLGSRVLALVLLILSAMPVLSLLPFFGGVDPGAVGRVTATTLLAVLYVGGHAIYFSATTDSPQGALVRTYWWLAVWLLAVPAAVMIPVNALRLSPATWLGLQGIGFLVNPLGPFLIASDGFAYQDMVRRAGAGFFPLAFALPTAWSFLLIGLAVKRLRQPPVSLWSPRWFIQYFLARLRADWDSLWEPILEQPDFRAFRVRNPLWRRARRTRVYDRAGYIGLIQWAGWAVVILFNFLLMGFDRRAALDKQSALMFLAPLWIGVTVLTTILAATSLVGDRRRGFLELVLLTRLRPHELMDGTLLALWEHLRRSFALVWWVALLFCLAQLPGPLESLCSAITATLFCALLALYGILFSLLARTTTRALLATFAFLVLANYRMIEVMPVAGSLVGSFRVPLSGLALLAGWLAVRWRPTLATVSSYLLVLHLVLVELATAVVGELLSPSSGYPLVAMAPAHLVLAPFRDPAWRTFEDGLRWQCQCVAYWAILTVNFFWVHRWAGKHFDGLVGRIPQHVVPAQPGPGPAR